MTQYNFDISGRMNVETFDDAVDTIKSILGEHEVIITRINFYDLDGMITKKCNKI